MSSNTVFNGFTKCHSSIMVMHNTLERFVINLTSPVQQCIVPTSTASSGTVFQHTYLTTWLLFKNRLPLTSPAPLDHLEMKVIL